MKTCKQCGETKPLDDFSKCKGSKDGKHSWCKECMTVKSKAYRFNNPKYDQNYRGSHKEEHRNRKLESNFGISNYEYNEILKSQGGVCAICGKSPKNKKLHVDHDHTTGHIRGLLCSNCNRGLGLYKDDPKILRTAAEYIESAPKDINLYGLMSQLGSR